MKESKIEWCDNTWNPWWGCTKVSDGCKNCYAETLSNRYGKSLWGPKGTRELRSDSYWNQPLNWNKAAQGAPRRPRVFCASMADVFEDRPELVSWRLCLFDLIRQTPNLDWLLLTKRPENVVRMIADCQCLAEGGDPTEYAAWIGQHGEDFPQTEVGDWLNEWTGERPPSNVWIGTSVENQEVADKRVPELLKIPAVVRFLSIEPLLGPVDLLAAGAIVAKGAIGYNGRGQEQEADWRDKRVDWVIVGGESGPGARPMEESWVRSIREECIDADLPLLFKQWGGVNKKATGRILDGITWDQFPATPYAEAVR